MMSLVREPAVSGMFYPDGPTQLRKEIARYLEGAHVSPFREEVLGIVSPHAGYVYSGQVAAYGFKAIAGKRYDTVIVIAPSHRAYFEGIAVWDKGAFRTPLGEIPIDEEIAGLFVEGGGIIRRGMEPHLQEHAVEVQLPFLQSVLKDFSLVPLVMGTQTRGACVRAAEEILGVLRKKKRKVLIIGSSDLSHYYPYHEATELDSVIVQDLKMFSLSRLAADIEEGKAEACGSGPMLVTLMVSEELGANNAKVLKYANSGDVSGDRSGVVGYVSALFYRSNEQSEELP